jgi:hypothetical protein
MADNKLLQQMLEHLVNDEQQKAEELFHEYVVAKSREIYEGLIESEIAEEEKDEEDEEDEMDEAAKDEDAEEDKVDEEFEDIAIEADDDMGDMGGDPTDDLEAELDSDMGDEEDDMGEKSEEELFQDLDAIVDELQAKFDELKGDEMGDDEEMKDDINDLETVREYVEKVGTPKMGDNGANAKSIVAGKNDMGGTTANIVAGGESKGEGTKGGLLNPAAKEDNAGNINVPGGKAGGAFAKKEPGHGAEKKGAAESADNKQSLFRGRR